MSHRACLDFLCLEYDFYLCRCKQDMALKWLIPLLHSSRLCCSKATSVTIQWFVSRRGNLYHWRCGCCLRSEWRRSASAWLAHSRRSRAHERVPLPAWWCWGPSVVWRSPLSGWSFSEPHTHPCTVRSGPAAGSASVSEEMKTCI